MNVIQPGFVTCPLCGCLLKQGRLQNHRRRVHGPQLTDAEKSQLVAERASKRKKSSATVKWPKRPSAVRKSEQELEKVIARLVSKPHKCAVRGCLNQIPATEEFCEDCKRKKAVELSRLQLPASKSGLCSCGKPALPGESSCYECIGD